MSEHLRTSVEHKTEQLDVSAELETNLERLKEHAEQAEKDPLQKHVESLQQSAEAQAISGKEFNVGDKQGENSQQSYGGIHKQLKTDAYKRTIRKIQASLPLPERSLSRVIHQPTIDAISNVAGKTIARPSGLLGGGFVALVGSAIFFYLARNYGFTYNYAVIFMLFVAGFVFASLLEIIVRFVLRNRTAE